MGGWEEESVCVCASLSIAHPPTYPPTHPPIQDATDLKGWYVVVRGSVLSGYREKEEEEEVRHPSTHPPTHSFSHTQQEEEEEEEEKEEILQNGAI